MAQVENPQDVEQSTQETTNGQGSKQTNTLPMFCNDRTMSLNPLIHTNIIQSPYFKSLFELKTYHEVIDEIYNKVKHLEPWERGSRRPESGNRSVSVRGVAAGGIVSSAFCLLYKLFTLKLTRKQLHGLLKHQDSPYIRGLGFLYIRYTMPPADFWEWYEPYLEDQEEIDLKAGGGQVMTIGEMCRHLITKLDWFSTLFPRLPVPMQKEIEKHLQSYDAQHHAETKTNDQQASPNNGKQYRRDNGYGSQGYRSRSDKSRYDSNSETGRYRDDYSRYRSHDSRGQHHRERTRDYSREDRHGHRRSSGDGRRYVSHRDGHSQDKLDKYRHHEQDRSYRGHLHHESFRGSQGDSRGHRSHRSRSRSPKDVRVERY